MRCEPTDADLDAIFDAALLFARGRDTLANTVSSLVASTGVKPRTARGYVQSIKKMINGEAFTINMSAIFIDLFLTKIDSQFRRREIEMSLRAIQTHIDYYEAKNGKNARSLRAVHADWIARITPKIP